MSTIPSTDIRRRILQDTDLIPTLPEVTVKVIAFLNEGDTQPEDLENLLIYDQALVARVLAMVNSPFFGLCREISRIKDAIMVLGYQNLRSLVIATSSVKHMRQDFSCYGYEPKGLWKHSVSIAEATKSLASDLGEAEPMCEEMFIAALLHDIGKMVMGNYLTSCPKDSLDGFASIEDAERELLGINHGEAGTLVAAKWNLSPLVSVIAEHHHDGEPSSEFKRYVTMLRIADGLMHDAGTGYLEGQSPSSHDLGRELAVLGVESDDWEAFKHDAEAAAELALVHIAGVYS